MKRILKVAAALLMAISSYANKANFQGKVYINGVPGSGLHTIQFYIGSPLNWSSIPTVININQGLYSTTIDFPDNIFTDQISSREMIVILDNNNTIDTVTIFAPLERDPTVRAYISDSITWANIHNKPTVDTSFTNEIQLLSLNGKLLGISNGNTVDISNIQDLTIYGKTKVIDTAIHQSFTLLGNSYTTCTGATDSSYWQSFRATENGKIRQISLPVAASCSSYVVVYIYAGIGNGSQLLGFKSCPVTNVLSLQTLDLSSGVNSSSKGYVTIESGKYYTFQITPPAGCNISVGCNSSNPYTDGVTNITPNTDIPFALNMDKSSPAIFSVNGKGYVGIGTDSATSELEVKGRIKDKTGFVMPVGSIMAYGGTTIPEGWLLCDGQAVSRTTYSDLYKEIGNAWGYGNNSTTFNLPDLRGQFIRGVDNSPVVGSANVDPDRSSRVASNTGGNSGNAIGSMQVDAIKQHTHQIQTQGNAYGRNGIVPPWGFYSSSGDVINTSAATINTLSSSSLANETRPKNVYVYYIIKY